MRGIVGLLLQLILLTQKYVDSGKILVLSVQFGSHLNEFAAVSEALLKMGHTVHVVMDENRPNPSQFKGMNVEFIHYRSPDKELASQDVFDAQMADAFLTKRSGMWTVLTTIIQPRFTYDCKMALNDAKMVERLKHEQYELVLADIALPCYHLLAHKLGVPTVTLSTTQLSWYVKTHPLVSPFAPCLVNKDTNTFFKRLKTFFEVLIYERVITNLFADTSSFVDYTPKKPYASLGDLVMQSKLFLYNRNGVIDCPTPGMPNLIKVGGLTARPAQPLQADYQTFVEEAKHGVIIVSFGSSVPFLPKDMFLKFIEVFNQIEQRIIWKTTKTYDEQIPKNVKIVKWLPQNDLMAHPSIKLFITHCGNNGQLEALFHGVPMLGFPIYGDQPYNTERMVYKGYGLGMDIHSFTTKELTNNIKEIITNTKYTEAIKKASKIQRTLPDPRDTSAFWIDHVITHGADHLTTTLSSLTFVQYFMLDVLLFLVVAPLILIMAVVCTFCCVKRMMDGNTKTKDQPRIRRKKKKTE
ncbi:UDP-glucuronosyltransferase 1A8-like [Lineus longissimus]|uniref:UDP-glucuronosyltransferase 1A8-like n=1 Tax=Lineus longissimus TaxID=88925 RepID=UPI00315D7A28